MIADINNLLRQLSSRTRPVDMAKIKRLKFSGGHLLVVRRKKHERIIGMATLTCSLTLMRPFGNIDDVVVDKAHQGKGIGASLMRRLIAKAKKLGLKRLQLTSRPSRKRANRLYKKLGFRLVASAVGKGDTNLYRLDLEP